MFPGDPIIELQLHHQRQKEFDRQLEVYRLLRLADERPTTVVDRALTTLGDAFIDLGYRLREHCAPEAITTTR